MEIRKIEYNWFQFRRRVKCEECEKKEAETEGESYSIAEVGLDGVSEIQRFLPTEEGNVFHYVIMYEDGREVQIYNPNRVYWEPTNIEENED